MHQLRVSTSSAPYSPKGELNHSFGLTGTASPVWGRHHSEEQKDLWSKNGWVSASAYPTIFIYDARTKQLIETVKGLDARTPSS